MYWCEGVIYSGTGFIDSCELSRGCWELNPGPFSSLRCVFLSLTFYVGYGSEPQSSCLRSKALFLLSPSLLTLGQGKRQETNWIVPTME